MATEQPPKVNILESSRIRILPFGISLPPSALQGVDEPTPLSGSELVAGDAGIVGNITLLKNSAMIWFGWGKLDRHHGNDNGESKGAAADQGAGASITGSGLPSMGQMAVGMPRTKYQGAFSSERESASSQLIGGESSDDQLVATKMASRLSQKLGHPVFVSCALSSTEHKIDPSILAGLDRTIVSQRAAALAERTAGKLLQLQGNATK